MIRRTDLEPACFYLRKSREDREAEAAGAGETLARHRRELYRLAKEYNVNVTKVFEEIVSGEKLVHRPEMLKLLEEVGAGKWRSVFCIDIQRLGRGDMQEQGLILSTFKDSNTLLITSNKLYDLSNEFDEEYTEFETFMGRKELKMITRRLQAGRLRSVKEGNYIGTVAPYGYEIAKKSNKVRYLVPHPVESEAVKLVFHWYVNEGVGIGQIARKLQQLGYPTRSGSEWDRSVVSFMLKNEVYVGRIQWKKKKTVKSLKIGQTREVTPNDREDWIDVKGKHEPLVSQELFDKAQEIITGKWHPPYQITQGFKNPLAGLVKCGNCGKTMVRRPYKNARTQLICTRKGCNRGSVFTVVEERLLEALSAWLDDYKNQIETTEEEESAAVSPVTLAKRLLQKLKRELKQLGQQKEKLHDLLERGIYDEETYLDRSQKLAASISEAELDIIDAERNLIEEQQKERAKKNVVPRLEKSLAIYNDIESDLEKNQLLKTILDYAVYTRDTLGKDGDFTLIIHPKTK